MMKKVETKLISSIILLSMIVYFSAPVMAYTKDESVYSKLDANGNIYKTIVSDHLKNKENDTLLKDMTDLMNIENVGGDQEFSKDGNKLTWKAEGNDIYYQGTTEKKLPIETKITYTLDDKEISKEDIVGKSGKVKITLEFTNKESRRVYVNGKYETMYVPFVVGIGTIINNEKNSDIEISSGKAIDDGSKTMIFGIALPGMQESLGVSKNTIDIPSSIQITMDAKEFKMKEIYCFASPKLIEEEDIKSLDKLDELYAKMKELKDASYQLVEGSTSLKDGANKIKNGVQELNNNYIEFDNGIKDAYKGSEELAAGVTQISTELGNLEKGTTKLDNGIKQINTALDNADLSGLSTLTEGIQQLDEGVNGQNGLANGVNSYVAGAENLAAGVVKLDSSLDLMISNYQAQKQAAIDEGNTELATQCEITIQTLQTVKANINTADQATGNSLVNGAKMLTTKDATAGNLTVGGKLKVGATKVSNGVTNLNNSTQDITNLGSKINDLKKNLKDVQKGTTDLNNGVKQLNEGSKKAAYGSQKLTSGLEKIDQGSTKIKEVFSVLSNGTKQIADGSEELANGMEKFDNEGIQKLYNFVNGDVKDIELRVEKLKELANEYNTFTSINENAEGNVKFIMIIDSIKQNEDKKEEAILPIEAKEKEDNN